MLGGPFVTWTSLASRGAWSPHLDLPESSPGMRDSLGPSGGQCRFILALSYRLGRKGCLWALVAKLEFGNLHSFILQTRLEPGGGGGLVAKLCPILETPMDCSPPGSYVQGILQARILEWIAISFSSLELTMCHTLSLMLEINFIFLSQSGSLGPTCAMIRRPRFPLSSLRDKLLRVSPACPSSRHLEFFSSLKEKWGRP